MFLSILKFTGILLAGIFGMLPLVFNFRDDEKKLTTWGKVALLGVVLSTAVSAASQYFELTTAKKEAEDSIERNNKLLAQISRSINLIKDVTLDACVESPSDDENILRYRQRIASIMKDKMNDQNVIPLSSGEFIIRQGSTVLPDMQMEAVANFALSHITIDLSFVGPTGVKDMSELTKMFDDGGVTPDLQMSFLTSIEGTKNQIYLAHANIATIITFATSDPKYWHATGKVRSIEDLLGTYMIVTLSDFYRLGDSRADALTNLRTRMSLRTMTLRMTDGRQWYFKESDFVPLKNSRNEPIFVFKFPSAESQFPTNIKTLVENGVCGFKK